MISLNSLMFCSTSSGCVYSWNRIAASSAAVYPSICSIAGFASITRPVRSARTMPIDAPSKMVR